MDNSSEEQSSASSLQPKRAPEVSAMTQSRCAVAATVVFEVAAMSRPRPIEVGYLRKRCLADLGAGPAESRMTTWVPITVCWLMACRSRLSA